MAILWPFLITFQLAIADVNLYDRAFSGAWEPTKVLDGVVGECTISGILGARRVTCHLGYLIFECSQFII